MSFPGKGPEQDQGRLGFVGLAERSFSFLSRLGFVVVRRAGTLVRFESSHVFVNIYHGRSSYVVGLEVGLLPDGKTYSLYEVLHAFAQAELGRASYQATAVVELEACLAKVARTLEVHCRFLLEGGAEAFERLDRDASVLRRKATMDAQFGAVRSRGDEAWDAKHWQRALEHYERAEAALSATQTRRLEFLRKRRP